MLPVHAVREPYRNRFFAVIDEEVSDRSGRPYTYHTVACAWDVVVVVPVLADGRLMLERIYRHPYRREFLEFPAGGIEPGEDPLAAAARELAEETGLVAGSLAVLEAYETLPGLLRMRTTLVLAEGCRPGADLAHEAMEHIQPVAMSRGEAWAAARGPEVPSAFLVAGLHALERARPSS